jgi:hypothetical protein
VDDDGPQIQAAKKRQLLVVSKEFIADSVKEGKKVDESPYVLKASMR